MRYSDLSDYIYIEGFEYPHEISQNPQKSTLNKTENRGYSKSSIDDKRHNI